MTVLVRLVMLFVGYALACLAASLVLTLGALAPELNDLFAFSGPHAREAQSAAEWIIVGFGAFVIFIVAFFPALLIVAITEGFALRSIVIYGLIGGALALTLVYGLDFAGYVAPPDVDIARQREVFAAAGIAGGLVYWLLAGRNAGAWK